MREEESRGGEIRGFVVVWYGMVWFLLVTCSNDGWLRARKRTRVRKRVRSFLSNSPLLITASLIRARYSGVEESRADTI